MDKKTCNRCGKVLSPTAFAKNPQKLDGRAGDCKECHKEFSRSYYKRNAASLEAKRKEYCKRADVKQKRKERVAYFKKHPPGGNWTCRDCGDNKPITFFTWTYGRTSNSYGQPCKDCARRRDRLNQRKWRAENPEKSKKYYTRFRKKHPEWQREYNRKRRSSPERKAQGFVYDALRYGLLVKPQTCSECGEFRESRYIHAHHTDYMKPLEVEWLCPKCHMKRHRNDS